MPRLTFSQALTANQLGFNPLDGWQFETVPYPQGAAVSVLVDATDANTRITVYSGSQTIQERSPIQAGGTLGVMPAPLNNTPITFIAGFMDRLKLAIDEVAGGVPSVHGVVEIEPL
ncbi:MAG: hypothetical protein ACYSUI_21420 [Planctomycetota bacterium]|jgi:hypothetical protein